MSPGTHPFEIKTLILIHARELPFFDEKLADDVSIKSDSLFAIPESIKVTKSISLYVSQSHDATCFRTATLYSDVFAFRVTYNP